jgi:hypothetical protein
MTNKRKRPTRRDLLVVIARCQNLFGQVAAVTSDRNPNRAADIERVWRAGFDLCVEAQSHDEPVDDARPWSRPDPEPRG